MYKQGYGYSYIARYLDLQGCSPPSAKSSLQNGKSGWNAVAVQRILLNRVYIGNTVQGVSEKVSFKSKKTRRLPQHRWVITENTHEAIIDRNDFEEVQKIREGKLVRSQRHKGRPNLFASVLYCGKCGSIMYARRRNGTPTAYVCSIYAKYGAQKCKSHHVYEEDLLNILYEELKYASNDREIVEKVKVLIKDYVTRESNLTRIDELEGIIEEKIRQQDIMYLDRLNGKISEQQFIRINNEIESQINAVKNDIIACKNRFDTFKLNDIDNLIKSIDVKDINVEIVKLLVEKIIVFDKEDEADKIYDKNKLYFNDLENGKNDGLIVVYFNHT